MIPWLPAGGPFPAVEEALEEPNGLLAAGGDLSPSTLLCAYRQGIFPWYDDSQPILWWSPAPRCVFRPGDLHLSRRTRRTLRGWNPEIRLDQNFAGVIDACAAPAPARTAPGSLATCAMLICACTIWAMPIA